jgi:hypothetical protein
MVKRLNLLKVQKGYLGVKKSIAKKTCQEPEIESLDIDSLNPLAPLMDIDQINS